MPFLGLPMTPGELVNTRLNSSSRARVFAAIMLALLVAFSTLRAQNSPTPLTPSQQSVQHVVASVSQQPSTLSTDIWGGSLGAVQMYAVTVTNYELQRWSGTELTVADAIATSAGLNVVAIQAQQAAIQAAQNRSPLQKFLYACQAVGVVEAGVTAAKLPNLPKSFPAVGVGVTALCTAATPWVAAKEAVTSRQVSAIGSTMLADGTTMTIAPGGAFQFGMFAQKVPGFKPVQIVVDFVESVK